MNTTQLNPKQIGTGKNQIRPEQITTSSCYIPYNDPYKNTGIPLTGNGIITTHTTGYLSSGLSLKHIQQFRQEVKDLPHPCLSFFLKCFNQDNTVTAIYNGDHIICKSEECYFDNIEFDPEVTKHQTCLSLNKEGLVNIIISFNQLSLAEIEILIRYLKQ